ncbi:lysylphosphatidylglycerol synthase domain-containing protein [Oxalobacteraceae bacterium R-40]|uniref:Lysylphosphatidylglycerol synthase domain-containing protein n=1 Tax=Keguizhuia sedimenti TaxID=3064264 RepID=A0ABU1BSK0_9BURK|nr:lysylphosphatidylglycerol synthase domain-containing protein [Oxalobacteraceae bacterium R-40]
MTSSSKTKAAPLNDSTHHSFLHGMTRQQWWPWAKRVAKIAFFVLVAYLIISQARQVDWGSVLSAMRAYPLQTLLIAAGLAYASYALYSCFDLLGRYTTGHGLAPGKVMTITFISYAFNLNFGSLIGGVAFRYRLYARLGLEAATTTRVLFLSMLTNWLGYILLAGLAFWLRPFALPPDWKLDISGLRILGMALVATAFAYLLLCAFAKRRDWTIKGHEISLPSIRFALLQFAMSSVNWLLISATVFMLLGQKIPFTTVLGVMLVAAIAGVITHVPAGLGVLEAVFVALLSHQVPKHELLAALLTYRAIYYIAPLIVATVVYLLVEARAKSMAAPATK